MKINEFELKPPKTNSGESYYKRNFIYIFIAGLYACFAFLLIGAINITIVKGKEYQEKAEINRMRGGEIVADRGIILDRNNKPLVENQRIFQLYINPTQTSVLEIKSKYPELTALIEQNALNFPYENRYFLLVDDLPKDLAIKFELDKPKGALVKAGTKRYYPYKDKVAHLLGYTGKISRDDLARDPTLPYSGIVGKSGVEYQYDTLLRGKSGYLYTETDALGNTIENGLRYLEEPKSGSNIVLTIDYNKQNELYKKVRDYVNNYNAKGGSGVIIDVNTGEIHALVSYPAYDNNLFIGGISEEDYKKLVSSPQTPLLYRPIGAQEPPGSTFKSIVATAALDTKAISENTTFYSPGVITLSGGYPFQDYQKRVYGTLNVRSGLMVSSNIFFCKTMLKLKIERFLPYAEKFGIGSKTGIDLPGEATGRLPSPENKLALYNAGATWLDPVWYPEGDSCNTAIGQGITITTPLQMASVAATIANGGKVYRPHIVKQYSDGEQIIKTEPVIVQQKVANPYVLKVVREGMRMSVAGPRAIITSLKYTPVTVAAKTGTAEFGVKDKNGYLTSHAWVIGFYPYEKPKYAFAILIEGGGSSSRAAFAMRDFLLTTKGR